MGGTGAGMGLVLGNRRKPRPKVMGSAGILFLVEPLQYYLGSKILLFWQVTTNTMAPAQSKLSQPEISRPRKRKVSSKIIDEDFVGVESNAVTKRLKLLANVARAAPTKQQKQLASVEDVEDESDVPINIPPKKPNAVLEATNGSDDDITIATNPAPPLVKVDSEVDDDNDAEVTQSETAEAEYGESNKML